MSFNARKERNKDSLAYIYFLRVKIMELDLSPKLARKVYGGNGGSYYAWSPSELPMLREGNIGAAKLALEKNGFVLPRYSDSAKVAYVLQGIYIIYIIIF